MTDRDPDPAVPLDDIHHVALAVPDVSAAVAWYRERFSCTVSYEDPTWAMLRFGNLGLALVTEGEHPPHIAFEREDAAQYGELRSHRDGTASVYLRDAGGNAVEIVKPAPAAPERG